MFSDRYNGYNSYNCISQGSQKFPKYEIKFDWISVKAFRKNTCEYAFLPQPHFNCKCWVRILALFPSCTLSERHLMEAVFHGRADLIKVQESVL
jgi:hypothetical protein